MKALSMTLSSTQVLLADGTGTVTASVHNASSAPERVVLGAFPAEAIAAAKPAPTSWATIDEPLRTIPPGAVAQFEVTLDASGAEAGAYRLKLIPYSADDAPEDYADLGREVLLTVGRAQPVPPPPPRIPWRLILIVLAALVVAGAILVVVLSSIGGGGEVDDEETAPPTQAPAAELDVFTVRLSPSFPGSESELIVTVVNLGGDAAADITVSGELTVREDGTTVVLDASDFGGAFTVERQELQEFVAPVPFDGDAILDYDLTVQQDGLVVLTRDGTVS